MEVGKKVLYDRIEQRELPKRFQLCYCFFAFVTRFFTFISLFFPLLLLSLDGFCQPEGELGILGGMGYYMGEYNPKIDIRERSLLSNGETVYPAGFHCTVKDVAAWIEFDFRSFGCRK